MVDKVDRPEAPPPYAVTHTTETKRDKPQDQKRQEDLPTFKKKEEDLYREKFQSEVLSKNYRLPLNEIEQLLFIHATPRHGVPMADAELILKDGKKITGVSFLLKNWQDFMQIKNIKTGQAIPQEFWNYSGTDLEITVKSVSTSGSWNLREIQKEAPPPTLQTAPNRIWIGFKKWWVVSIAAGVVILWTLILLKK